MRHAPASTTPLSSWSAYKQQGKTNYDEQNFGAALTYYSAALNPELSCPPVERQVILSNMVACRLKIGGPAHARAAVENAKQVSIALLIQLLRRRI